MKDPTKIIQAMIMQNCYPAGSPSDYWRRRKQATEQVVRNCRDEKKWRALTPLMKKKNTEKQDEKQIKR